MKQEDKITEDHIKQIKRKFVGISPKEIERIIEKSSMGWVYGGDKHGWIQYDYVLSEDVEGDSNGIITFSLPMRDQGRNMKYKSKILYSEKRPTSKPDK